MLLTVAAYADESWCGVWIAGAGGIWIRTYAVLSWFADLILEPIRDLLNLEL